MNLKKIFEDRFYIGFANQCITRDDIETAGYDSEYLMDEDMIYLASKLKDRLMLLFEESEMEGISGREKMLSVFDDVLGDEMEKIVDSESETIVITKDDLHIISFGENEIEAQRNLACFIGAIKKDVFFSKIKNDIVGIDISKEKIVDSIFRIIDDEKCVSQEEVEQFLIRFANKYVKVKCLIYKDELPIVESNTNNRKKEKGTFLPQVDVENYDKKNVMTPVILSLESQDYVSGPNVSKDTRKNIQDLAKDFYVFGKEINGDEIYIKISEGTTNVPFVFSFHKAKYPLKYKFKNEKE